MFTIMLLSQNIADDHTDYLINDRLSFQRVLGLRLSDNSSFSCASRENFPLRYRLNYARVGAPATRGFIGVHTARRDIDCRERTTGKCRTIKCREEDIRPSNGYSGKRSTVAKRTITDTGYRVG
jgi:hypothetical protein